MAPHDGQKARDDGHHRHHLGAQAQGGAVNDRLVQAGLVRFAAGHQIVPGVVEVDQHQHPRLHGHPGQGDEADTDAHREVEVEQPNGPDPPDHRQRQGGEDEQHLLEAVKREIEQQHDNGEGQGHHVGEALHGPLHVFVLT